MIGLNKFEMVQKARAPYRQGALERMKLNNVKRDWLETSKVKVYGEKTFISTLE